MAQETVVEILAKFRADIADFNKKLSTVQKELDDVKRKTETTAKDISGSFDLMGNAANRFATSVGGAAAIAGGALVAIGIQSFRTAAEVQELDTVMQVVGATTGVTYKVLKDTADAIRSNGIEYASAQQMAIKFAKNQLNLADAANIARVAQDLAVISQSNSTETADRLTYAVLNLNSMMLRNAGVQTTVSQAVKAYARENNVSAASMTTAQKQQAVLNAILEEGKKISGVYTMSMTNAGKVLRSFARITKDIQGELGGAFLDALGPIILKFYDLYKAFSLTLREGGALHRIIEALSAVFMNLAAPLGVALDKAIDFVKNMDRVTTGIGYLGNQIQKYMPVILALGAAFATIGGKAFLGMVPILGQFLGALNPLMVGFTVLVALSPKLQAAFVNLLNSLKPFLPVLLSVGAALIEVANLGVDVLAKAINGLAGVINSITSVVENYSGVLTVLATVGIAVVIAATVLWIQKMKKAMVAQLALITAQIKLNAKLILVAAAVAILVVAFVKAWNSTEGFRKAVIGLGKLFITFGESVYRIATTVYNGLLLMTRAGANARIALGKVFGKGEWVKQGQDGLKEIDKVNAGFQKTIDSFETYRQKLDSFNEPIDLSNISTGFKYQAANIKKIFEGLFAGGGNEGGGNEGGGVKAVTNNLREAIQKYNDFINNEFVLGFQKDSETARDTVIKSLSMLKSVFDEQAKGLKGDALKNLEDAYWKTDAVIREFIPQAEKLGAAFEEINKAIEEANDKFKKVTQDREDAVAEFAKLMRQPFGEPNQITKALSSAEATVDSIISMYDNLVEQINKRYSEIDPTGRDNLIEYLTNQTQMLVDLAKKRLVAADKLQEAQEALNSVVAEQKQFASDVKSSLSGFATALADISTADSAAVIQVIKTSTGLVITQMQQSSSGVNKITDQLRQRLADIQNFARNIKTLLAQGLNKDYVRQLLEAGPEAAGQTAQLLTTVGSEQINEINSLYSQIGTVSEMFSRDMADLFYGGAVASATAIRDGYQKEYDGIMSQMDAIKKGIEEKLKPLSLLGSNLGKDLMAGLIKKLNDEKAELIKTAESIATAIAAALSNAALGIGVGLDTLNTLTATPDPTYKPFNGSITDSANSARVGTSNATVLDTPGSNSAAFNIKIDANMDTSQAVAIVKDAIRGVMVAK